MVVNEYDNECIFFNNIVKIYVYVVVCIALILGKNFWMFTFVVARRIEMKNRGGREIWLNPYKWWF